jgi:hypothetical protein
MAPSLPPRQLAALRAVDDLFAREKVEWLLAGSAGRALLGWSARPDDLDIEVHPADDLRASRALGVDLSEERTPNGIVSLRARTAVSGVEVDVTSAMSVEGPDATLPFDFAAQVEASHTVELGGRAVRVAPPEEAFARAIVLADWERLARLAAQAGEATIRPAYVVRRLSSAAATAAS